MCETVGERALRQIVADAFSKAEGSSAGAVGYKIYANFGSIGQIGVRWVSHDEFYEPTDAGWEAISKPSAFDERSQKSVEGFGDVASDVVSPQSETEKLNAMDTYDPQLCT